MSCDFSPLFGLARMQRHLPNVKMCIKGAGRLFVMYFGVG